MFKLKSSKNLLRNENESDDTKTATMITKNKLTKIENGALCGPLSLCVCSPCVLLPLLCCPCI